MQYCQFYNRKCNHCGQCRFSCVVNNKMNEPHRIRHKKSQKQDKKCESDKIENFEKNR